MNETEFFEHPGATQADETDQMGEERPVESTAAEPQDDVPMATETDEAADLQERAEAGDAAAEVALEEAGGAEEPFDEAPSAEQVEELEAEAAPLPGEDDITDVPTEEATIFEAEAEAEIAEDRGGATMLGGEAEAEIAEDTVEGEDTGPEVATGPDLYVEPPQEEEVIDLDG